MWLNVETNPNNGCEWYNKTSSKRGDNCKLIKTMADEIKKQGKYVGIYSNIFMWNYYIGENTPCLENSDGSIVSWYPHDDKLPNFYDYYEFGNFGPF